MSKEICVIENVVGQIGERSEDYIEATIEGRIDEGEVLETGQQVLVGCPVDGCNAEIEIQRDKPDSIIVDVNLESVRTAAFICKARKNDGN